MLLVLDDVDRAGVELRAALGTLVDGLAQRHVLVVATAADPALAPAPGAGALLVLGPLEAGRGARRGAALRRGGG